MEETVTIFGIRAILEAIESGKSLDRVWLLKGTQSKLFEQLLHVLRNKNIAFSFVPVERLDRFSSKNHQGAVARIGALSTQDMEPLIESVLKEKENPVFVLLDGVTDTRNFGAILRSAAATGVDAVFISSTGSAPLNGDVVKTSAGGAFKVPISKVQHLKDVVYYLKAHDIPTLGITEKSTETLYDSDLKGPLALVFGAEDVGISNGLLKILDHKAKLPMTEAVDSLNVSVACAVVFYETIRQRR
ncbi:23S rRNA (guanosine(2251)-2'-O)-methyltransferase RlmB [Flavobacteriaceae bacterium]|jgi:23S rRNA (guanosine2251-2'-O)-methyltransferase|nr:23S rRNA (guanosine(2251)-2'-O)-methyltransferase RlmB [Flavobacteriaceae bacterium]MBT5693828.1 23S rRNA (guanosine(2251)-2'-O)-methyltransferase RlmB [Flavobacteriaceae bacterium]MBT5975406.1 23S rRNA (guanosine(2251)-2'-O)-methyltransferase RlmB [Flavobacteriaceae bacterium]MBT7948235.1 23S rRNA (guanosine(2251)-2'-O)-methyltransferase RlmB [Flavobacteriaceae bacterium]MDA7764594.1 23S rRNA (guanosine(2251)-2'-O)-methyltransferase RlmB [Flavobacteriaceae bacterium]|tara:strand:- start:21523 stop:22257 length:735 start_codon:yes stop_codon:yes gene_type:complete